MSTKKERTAWNLTKIAAETNIRYAHDKACTCLYEIAEDNKIAMIEGRSHGIDTMVFIPSSVWDNAYNMYEAYKDSMLESYAGDCWAESEMCHNLVKSWYFKAMRHEY